MPGQPEQTPLNHFSSHSSSHSFHASLPELPLTTSRSLKQLLRPLKTSEKDVDVSKNVEKLRPMWECKVVQPLWRKVWQFLKKLNGITI